MKNMLKEMLELNRDPALCVRKGKVSYLNAPAKNSFPWLQQGTMLSKLLPALPDANPETRILTSVELEGRQYVVRMIGSEQERVITFQAVDETSQERELLTEQVMGNLFSSLFNLKLAMDWMCEMAVGVQREEAREMLAIARQNYYLLKVQMEHLSLSLPEKENLFLAKSNRDLVGLCATLTEEVMSIIGEQYAPLCFSTPLDELIVYTDVRAVERMLLALIRFLFTHTPSDKEIRIRLVRKQKNAEITLDGGGSRALQRSFGVRENTDWWTTDADPVNRDNDRLSLDAAGAIARNLGGVLFLEDRDSLGVQATIRIPTGANDLKLGVSKQRDTGLDHRDRLLTELSPVLSRECYLPEEL